MNRMRLSLAAAMLFAAGSSFAADNAIPPPPPAGGTTPTTPAAPPSGPVAGRAGKMGAMGEHLPLLGLIKQVEEKGKVTKEEFLAHARKQAEEMFSKLDKNNDGAIDKSEIADIESKLKGAREKIQERAKGAGVRRRPGAEDQKKPTT